MRARVAVLVAGVVAAAAAWLAASDAHRYANGDTIVPVLSSLRRWTAYYWGQDRFGMLAPLLAFPVRDPLWNLMVQSGIYFAALIAAPLLTAWALLPRRLALTAGLLASAALIALQRVPVVSQLGLGSEPYALALCLAAPAMRRLRSRRADRRHVVAWGCLALALWVNIATVIVVCGWAALRAALTRRGSLRSRLRAGVHAPLFLAGGILAVAHRLLAMLAPREATRYQPEAISEWLDGWSGLLVNAARDFATPGATAALACAAAAGAALLRIGGRRGRAALAIAAALLTLGFAEVLVMGVVRHVHENLLMSRYLFTPLLLLHVAAAGLVVAALHAVRPPARAALRATAALALLGVAATPALRFAPPSPARVRATYLERFGDLDDTLIATGATHLAGMYWTVWPAVFVHQLKHGDEPGYRHVWGLAYRASATERLWRTPPEAMRILAIESQRAHVARLLRVFRLRPTETIDAGEGWTLRRPAAFAAELDDGWHVRADRGPDERWYPRRGGIALATRQAARVTIDLRVEIDPLAGAVELRWNGAPAQTIASPGRHAVRLEGLQAAPGVNVLSVRSERAVETGGVGLADVRIDVDGQACPLPPWGAP